MRNLTIDKLDPIVKGVIKSIPGVKKFFPPKTGGTDESRYCYSIWLRHLKYLSAFTNHVPDHVAELGPGDSLGTGLAALLSGSKGFHALDIIKYWNNERNLKLFEELIELFSKRERIPDDKEFPMVRPLLDNYDFPSNIITESVLKESLEKSRLDAIRKAIMDVDNPENTVIKYHIPWDTTDVIDSGTIDYIFSQGAVQSIEDLESAFSVMRKWLKPSGYMSHLMDLRSLATTKRWNGHYTFSDFEWDLVKRGKIYTTNRQPYSKYIELHEKYGFKILVNVNEKFENSLKTSQLADKFKHLSEEDLTTGGLFLVSQAK